jgi:hypothetical protein
MNIELQNSNTIRQSSFWFRPTAKGVFSSTANENNQEELGGSFARRRNDAAKSSLRNKTKTFLKRIVKKCAEWIHRLLILEFKEII